MLDTSKQYALIDKTMPAMIVPSPTYPVKIKPISQKNKQIANPLGNNANKTPIIVPAPFPPLKL